jgi:hypothetical protein
MGEYVSDDDSSSQAILAHLYQDLLIEAGLMTKEDWPKYKNAALKTGNG